MVLEGKIEMDRHITEKEKITYNVGLDIGTKSVGWAVTDLEGKLQKFRKKNMMGVRLFEVASTAENRRINRNTRRRYERRKLRIECLKKMFAPLILPIDKDFFARLDEAFLWREDKTIKSKHILFADENFTDQDFYKEYQTIYHLRKFLVETDEKADPRFIYLALHHMIKYRGNFLEEGKSLDVVEDVQELFRRLSEELCRFCEKKWKYGEHFLEVQRIMENMQMGIKRKKEQIVEILTKQYKDKKIVKEITNAMLGYTFDIEKILPFLEIKDESGLKIKVAFNDGKYEDLQDKLKNLLGEAFSIVEVLNQIYSWYILKDILRGEMFLSAAMVRKYEEHGKDLRTLKSLMKQYLSQEQYNYFFREEKQKNKYIPNYYNYRAGKKRCSKTNLYKTITKLLGPVAMQDVQYQQILERMEREEFLATQREMCNAVIPYKCNEIEMKSILEKQGKFYPELKSNTKKILQLLYFRIPYYVGPLVNEEKSSFAWMSRKAGMENETIYPWNFEKVVDIDRTAEKFISRMKRKCVYLPKEDVLPKNSLLYSEFELLQELNKVKINGKFICVKDRNEIIEKLFKKKKHVFEKDLMDWYVNKKANKKVLAEGVVITGLQKKTECASSLTSFIDFTRIFGKITEKNCEMIETMIYWLTIFEDKKIVKRKIEQNYKQQVTQVQMAKVLHLNYVGWGRCSKKLLIGIQGYNDLHEQKNIMEILYEGSNARLWNLEEILRDEEMGFDKEIDQHPKGATDTESLQKMVQELYVSPEMKRGIWQSIKIVDEIVSIMKSTPKNIFFKIKKENRTEVKAASKIKRVERLYEKFKKEEGYNREAEKKLKETKYQNCIGEEKIFLYFTQNGRCLYSGEMMDIERIEDYVIDSIIPCTLLKDDSIQNKALVTASWAQKKGDAFVPHEWQERQKKFWKQLLDVGLMENKKYENLCRESFGNEREKKKFISQQIVENRQCNKQIASILMQRYPNVNAENVKAERISELRQNLIVEEEKSSKELTEEKTLTLNSIRSINDFYFAQEAYLTNLVGSYIKVAFPKYEKEIAYNAYQKYCQENSKKKNMGENCKPAFSYVMSRFFEQIVDGNTGILLWDGTNKLRYIKKIFGYRDFLVTKKLEENTGQFYDQTIYPKEKGKKEGETCLIPLKKGLSVEKYGGYKGSESAYYSLIENKKGKLAIVGIPIMVAKQIDQKQTTLEKYLKEKMKTKEFCIIRKRIMKNQLIEENGNRFFLTAASEVVNAKQFIIDGKHQHLLQTISLMEKGRYEGADLNKVEKDMDELYCYYLQKIQQQYSAFENIVRKISDSKVYESLHIENQKETIQKKGMFLMQLLRITRANAECADLKKISGGRLSDRMGRKNYYSAKHGMKIIDQSVTGLYEWHTIV